MGRLLAFAGFFGLAAWLIAVAATATFGRPRDAGTYRPRWAGWFGKDADAPQPGTMHLVKRAELKGLRDAYSSASIDLAQPLLRCGRCLATYHAASVAELDRSNEGRCVVCGSQDLAAVYVADE